MIKVDWWFILALLSAFFAALVAIFAKVGLAEVDSNLATAIRSIVMTVFILCFVASLGKFNQISQIARKDMISIVLSGVAGALSWLCYFAALTLTDASKVAPIDRSSVLMVIILAALFLGEKVTLKTAAAGILVFLGILLLALK